MDVIEKEFNALSYADLHTSIQRMSDIIRDRVQVVLVSYMSKYMRSVNEDLDNVFSYDSEHTLSLQKTMDENYSTILVIIGDIESFDDTDNSIHGVFRDYDIKLCSDSPTWTDYMYFEIKKIWQERNARKINEKRFSELPTEKQTEILESVKD